MKKKLGVIALTALSIFTLGGVVLSTYSWFVASMKTPEYNLKGKSAGAYFAYGDGKPYEVDNEGKVIHRPFGISIPRHLYNLSWLQYMGQFADDQYYFEIASTVDDEDGLDMDGYTLPPIGTTDNPFIGDFNGNGKIIKNLTVSNDEAELFSATNKHPDQTQVTYTEPEIVGLFGVVGNYNDSFEGTYDSSINSIHDLGISGLTVETTTARALVGICAGYVDAEISNVAVNESTIDVQTSNTAAVDSANITENLSDYGVVGYCTDDYKKSIKKMEQNLYDVEIGANATFNATDSGDSLGWGGSIDMNSIFSRLTALRTNNNTTSSHPFTQTVSHYNNDELGDPTVATNSNQSVYRFPEDNNNYTNFGENTTNYRGSINYGHSESSKHYLVGGTYQTHNYYTYYEHTGVKINDGNGHYLTTNNIANNQNVTQSTTEDNAIVWVIESGDNPRIYTEYNGTPYYLNYYNDTTMRLGTTAGSATRWNKETNTSGGVRYTYNNRMIAYNNNAWSLVAALQMPTYPADPVDPYDEPTFDEEPPTVVPNPGERPADAPAIVTWTNQLYFNDNGTFRFLAPPASNDTDGNIASSNTPLTGGWTRTADGNYYTFRMTNNNSYYLRSRTNNTTYRLTLTNSNSNTDRRRFTQTDGGDNDNNTFYYHYNNRYLRYNNGNFSINTTQNTTTNSLMYFETIYEYNGTYYRTQAAANSARQTDVADITQRQQQWDIDKGLYDDYLVDQAAYEAAEAAWQAEHDTWVADNEYRENYQNYVNQYYADLDTYNDTFYIGTTDVTAENPVIGPDSHQTQADINRGEEKMVYTYEDTSYFPINVDANYEAKLENTGYFVAGSTDKTWASGSNCPRSLIFSSYTKTQKIRGYDNTNKVIPDSEVYTVDFNQSNQRSIHAIDLNSADAATKYSKYADSKAGLEKVLKDATNVGGFHFYAKNADYGYVSKDAVVNARDVRMRGASYRNYELPVNALDFYLKEKGRVNFFAGMYNGGGSYGTNTSGHMNGFFSLYRVLRDSNDHITDIREVQAIYGNEDHKNWSYIYEYKNGKFSEPYRIGVNSKYVLTPDNSGNTPYVENHDMASMSTYTASAYGYKKLFDNDWLGYYYYGGTDDYRGRVFYFEIPTDEGEYCLGRYETDGTAMDGAYLMYLDIGANAAKTERTTVYERYTEIKKVFDYPTGVAIVSVSTVADNLENEANLDETNTANFLIVAGTSGTITVTRASNDVEMARTGGLLTSAKPTLVGDLMWDDTHLQYNIHDPGGSNLSSEITSENTTTEVRRLQYYDWNVNMSELMITHITDTSTDGGETWERTYYQEYANGSSTTTFSEMKIYNTSNGVKYLTENDLAGVLTYLGTAQNPQLNNTIILKISYQEDDGENITYEWALTLGINSAASGTGQYYTITTGVGQYVFLATVDNGSVTLTVMSVNSGGKTLKINDTAITTAGQTVTITPVAP